MRISTFGYVGNKGLRISGEIRCSRSRLLRRCRLVFFCLDCFSIILNFQYIIKMAEEGVAITVFFFEEDATQAQIDDIGEELRGREDVSEVKYVSADEAWENYKKEYFKDKPELAEGFKDDNPLGGFLTTMKSYENIRGCQKSDGEK